MILLAGLLPLCLLAQAPGPSVRPRAADIMPLAPRRLVLDLVDSGEHLFAVGERGHILVSNDGAAWAQLPAPVRSALTAVTFADAGHGWAVGHDATILYTDDGGRSWQLQNFEPEREMPFLDVLFIDAQKGFAVGAYGLLYATRDGGTSWEELEAAAIREPELHFNAITRLASGELFIVGETGMMGLSADGARWQRLSPPYAGSLFGALPHGPRGALVYGLGGYVLVTDDVRAGRWRKIDTGTAASFFGGSLLPDGRAALVGLGGALCVVDAARGTVESLHSGVASSQGAVLAWRNTLVIGGESGLRLIALAPPPS